MGKIRKEKTKRKALRQIEDTHPSKTSNGTIFIIFAILGLFIARFVFFHRGSPKLSSTVTIDPQVIVLMILFLALAGLIGLIHWTAGAATGALFAGGVQFLAGSGWLELTIVVLLGFLVGTIAPFFWKLIYYPFSFPVRDVQWSTRSYYSGYGGGGSGGGFSGGGGFSSGGGGFSGGGGGFGGGGASGSW